MRPVCWTGLDLACPKWDKVQILIWQRLRESHQEPDKVALAVGAGFTHDGFELIPYGSSRDPAEIGDFMERIAHQDPICDFHFCRCQCIESSKDIVGESNGSFRIGHKNEEIRACAGALHWG